MFAIRRRLSPSIRRPDRGQTGGAIVPTPRPRLHQLEDDGIVVEQRGQLRWVARIDLVELLGDVTTTWPQNSIVALDCEARIIWARSGFQQIRIAIMLTPATHCHALPGGGR
jgi:hypothetical protein